MSRQTTAEAGRLLGVQVLRFVAAALVLGHNAVLFAAAFAPTFKANLDTGLETGLDTRLETGPMVADVVTAMIAGAAHWSHMGTAGVHIFFVISGCVMALTAHEAFGRPGAARAFLWRRAIRIYPIYWLTALLYLAAQIAMGSFALSPGETLAAALLLPGHAGAIIVPGWTLAYEMLFYALFAGLLLVPRAQALWLISLGVPGLILCGALVGPDPAADPGGLGHWGPLAAHLTSPLLIEFLAGVWLGWGLRMGWLPRLPAWSFWPGVAGLGLVLAFSPALTARGLPEVLAHGPASLALVALFALHDPRRSGGAWPRWLVRAGEGSYALYLIHQLPMLVLTPVLAPVLALLAGWVFGAGVLGGLGAFAATVLALCLVALALGQALHAAERPLMAWLRAL